MPICYGLPETSYGRPAPDRTCSPHARRRRHRQAVVGGPCRPICSEMRRAGWGSCPSWRAGCGPLGSVLGHLAVRSMSHGDPQWLRLGGPDAIAALSVLASLLLFSYTRRGDRDPMSILDLGLAYMVFTAFALGLTFHWAPLPANHSISPAISWIGAVVLMFAAIVPSTPAKTLLAGVLAVSMNPIAMWIARARGTLELRSHDRRLAHALSGLPSARRRRRHLTRRHRVGAAGRESARDGKLSARRAAGSWRDGRGLPRDAPHARAAGGDQADSSRGAWRERSGGRATRRHAFPPRGRNRRQPAVSAHRGALRLWRHGRPDAVFRHGIAGGPESRITGAPARSLAAGPCGSHPSPGVRVTRRGARARPGASRHQARQHPCRTAGTRLRLREGARLRSREAHHRWPHSSIHSRPRPAW